VLTRMPRRITARVSVIRSCTAGITAKGTRMVTRTAPTAARVRIPESVLVWWKMLAGYHAQRFWAVLNSSSARSTLRIS
jgi:hypothetical protein